MWLTHRPGHWTPQHLFYCPVLKSGVSHAMCLVNFKLGVMWLGKVVLRECSLLFYIHSSVVGRRHRQRYIREVNTLTHYLELYYLTTITLLRVWELSVSLFNWKCRKWRQYYLVRDRLEVWGSLWLARMKNRIIIIYNTKIHPLLSWDMTEG